MATTPTKTLVVTTGDAGVPVLAEPVRLVNPDGTDWQPQGDAPTTIPQGALTVTTPLAATRDGEGTITIALPDGSITADKLADGVIPAAPTWATISGKPAAWHSIASPTDTVLPATIDAMLDAMRDWGIIERD